MFNREGTPQNVTSYFTLTDDGSDNYNVITTSTFISNVYYGSNSGQRQFDFTFEVQLTDGGSTTTTTITKEALLGNLVPTMFASDGTTTPPNGAVGTVGRNTSTILTVTGKNGGNSNHSGKDLTWTITSATNSSGSSVSHFSLITSNTNSLSTCQVINDLAATVNIPVDDYTIGLRLQDAGGVADTLTITVSFGNAITSVKRTEAIYEPNAYDSFDVEFTELYFSESISTDGYYLYNGDWESLQQQEADATNAITVDNTNASKSSSNCTSNDWAYHSGVSGVRTILENCEYNGNLFNFGYGTAIAQSEIDAYSFVIT